MYGLKLLLPYKVFIGFSSIGVSQVLKFPIIIVLLFISP